MEYPGAERRGRIFLSCKKQKHHSREVMLPQHALVHVFAGVLEIAYAEPLPKRFAPATPC